MPLLTVPFDGPYQVALASGFLVGAVLAWRSGRSAGLPPLAWAVVLGVGAAAGLIGSKLFFFDLRAALPGEKTVLGGILLGVTLVPLAARALGLRAGATLDRLTVPTLVAMAIGRLGCFLAGCCLGTHSSLLDARHPTVLYEAGLDLALVALLVRRVPAGGGLRIGVGVLGYGAIRFATEFVRDGRTTVGGLNPVQWFMLVVVAAAALWTLEAARRSASASPVPERPRDGALAVVGLVAALAALLGLAPEWITPLERFVLGGIALAVGSLGLWLAAPRPLRAVGLPVLGALAIATPPDTVGRAEIDIGIDRGGGSYDRLLVDGGCDPSTYEARESSVTQFSFMRRRRNADGWRALSIVGAVGNDRSDDPAQLPDAPIRAVGVGASAASASAVLRASFLYGDVSREGDARSALVPMLGLRLGRRGPLFFEGQLAPEEYFPTTGEFTYVGVGLQFAGQHSRLFVGGGEGIAVDAHVPVHPRLTLRAAVRKADIPSRSFVKLGGTWHLRASPP